MWLDAVKLNKPLGGAVNQRVIRSSRIGGAEDQSLTEEMQADKWLRLILLFLYRSCKKKFVNISLIHTLEFQFIGEYV